jgi:hypothetical protein
MKRKSTGTYRIVSTVGEPVRAFIPDPLPPKPPLEISPVLWEELDRALIALGRLDSASIYLPA